MRRGCDAVLLDLHGAMVVEDADDAEGEILRRVRTIAPRVPVAVTFDYHTNLSPETIANATIITGYKTYPHIDMYEAGRLAGDILARTLRGEVEPVLAWGWLPLIPSIMRHAPEDGPSGEAIAVARAAERAGEVLAATLLPAFAHADTPFTGCSAVVVGDERRGWQSGSARDLRRDAEDRMGAARRVCVSSAAARRIRRAREAARRGESCRTGVADRPLRQLRLRRRTGCDDGGRRDSAAGSR